MIHEYPDTRQNADHNCGEAAVLGVLSYRKLSPSLVSVDLSNDSDGMHPSTLYALLRRFGMRLQCGTYDIADLAAHTKRGRPVLCPVDLYGGHWITVLGVARTRVHYHCPVKGLCRLWDHEFETLWKDSTREGHPFDHWGIVVL